MLDLAQQIHQNISQSNNPLIAFRKDYNGDALASSLGLAKLLQKMGTKPDIVCDKFNPPNSYDFLPDLKKINPRLSELASTTVSLDLGSDRIKNINYQIDGGKLHLNLLHEKGISLSPRLSDSRQKYKYDLIFTLNTPDMESLGKIYEENTDFFYETPIINIDHLSHNESYGQINVIDTVSSSTAEIIFNLLEFLGKDYLDEDIATCLLTGIITKTKSFRIPNITPKTLNIAGQLLVAGGRREDIIKNLYHNKTLTTLKLWGRVLARLKNDKEKKLVWSTLSQQDFIAAGAEENEMMDVVYELIANSPEADVIVLMHEKQNGRIFVHVYSEKNINSLEISKIYSPQGTADLARFFVEGKNLVEAEREVISSIQKFI